MFESYVSSTSLSLPSFSKLRLFSASWSAFLWYSVNLCCSMILSFSSRDMLASALFLRFACDKEQQSCYDVTGTKKYLIYTLILPAIYLKPLLAKNKCQIYNIMFLYYRSQYKYSTKYWFKFKKKGNVTSSSSSFMIFSILVFDVLLRTEFQNKTVSHTIRWS